LAPFQLLAAQGASFHDRPHDWHLAVADRLVAADPQLITATRRRVVDCDDPASVAAGVAWWEELTAGGGEGMERVARGEPLWRVHECVFAVLACESEPVDPRL
jgi:hypothetical protein